MDTLFPFAPAIQQSQPVAAIGGVVSACQIQALSGILEISGAAGGRLALFLAKGKLQKTFAFDEATPRQVEPGPFSPYLHGETATVRILSFAPDIVQELQNIFDWHSPLETTPLADPVQRQLEALNAGIQPCTVHLTWADAEGLIAMPGNNRLPDQALFMRGGKVVYGAEALQVIYTRPAAGGILTRYETRLNLNEQHQQATQLQAIFSVVVPPLLGRYTDLAGSGIVTSLRHDLNDLARANQWQILATPGGFTDTHPFETPAAAARAYSVLLKAILTHMSAIIGGRLANTILREAAQQLAPADYELVRTYHLIAETVLTGKTR